ncbi:putative PurR-regulated permease PerM [Microbacterium resistens]|uniref:PurR-regulated permease PerM n=1 Tax=Microbacterium resistens TaxID=156977 RepID=A0ABU1SBL2_9MICO|nr:AI-2E family transporter [Microbacterium resistens]MDR6866946.1 putative PurR-regulated permease PerM [Microbacterium resistens]
MSHDENATEPAAKDATATAATETVIDDATEAASASTPGAADSPPESPARPYVEATQPRASFWTRVDKPFVFGFLATLGGLAAILLGLTLSNLSTVLIYIAFALFAALGLDPAVRFLERRGLSRGWSVLIVILSLLALLAIVLILVVPIVISQVTIFAQSIQPMIRDFMSSDVYHWLEGQFGSQFEDLFGEVQKFLTDPNNIAMIGGGALQVGASIASGISGTIIVLVLTLYFIATLPAMKESLLRLAPARDRARASDITDQITSSVGGYVQGMVILAFINAMLALLLYTILGLPFPPLMATVAFAVTLIPLVGPVLFWVIGSGIALFSDPIPALIFAIVYLVYMQIEAYVLTPRVMSKAVSVPGALVVIGALAGGTLLGLLGALVAVPVAASVLIIVKQVWIPRQDARR